MSSSANVRSVDAIARFTGAMREFEDEARNAVIILDQQLQRALEWLDHEQPLYWERRIRLQYEEVARKRSELENCQMRVVAGERPACLEEEKALRKSKDDLNRVLEKPDLVRKWSIRIHREADEFRARTSSLRHCVAADIPHIIALLERTVAILDAYSERQNAPLDEAPGDSAPISQPAVIDTDNPPQQPNQRRTHPHDSNAASLNETMRDEQGS